MLKTVEGTVLAPDRNAAEQFLTVLDEYADRFTFQTYDDSREKRSGLARIFIGRLEDHWDELVRLNQRGAGVFVSVNEMDDQGRGNKHLVRIRAVFQEDDGAGKPLPLEPHMVVESSPGHFHRWVLCEDMSPEEYDGVMETMVAEYGSDPNAKDRARVLRLAGFYNRKRPEPHMVRIVEQSAVIPYPGSRVMAAFPPTVHREQQGQKAPGQQVDPHKIERLISELMSGANYHDAMIRLAASFVSKGIEPRHVQAFLEAMMLSHRADGDHARWQARFAEIPAAVRSAAEKYSPATIQPVAIESVEISDLMTAVVPGPEFIIDPLIPREHVTLMSGHGGAGKSVVALTMSAHIACGENWAGFAINPRRVLYVSLEDGARMVRSRLKKIIEHYGLPIEKLARNMVVFDGSRGAVLAFERSSNGLRELVFTAVADQIREAARGFDMVVIDNASDAYAANENERRMVREFVHWLAESVRAHNGAVLLLAHVDKATAKFGGNGNSYSGSTAWHNSARSRLALVEDELRQEKLNVGRKHDAPIQFYWTETGIPVPDVGGAHRQQIEETRSASEAQGVLDALKDARALGVDVPDAAVNARVTAWSVLSEMDSFPDSLRGKESKQRVSNLLLRLEMEGSVRKVEVKDKWRNVKLAWEVA